MPMLVIAGVLLAGCNVFDGGVDIEVEFDDDAERIFLAAVDGDSLRDREGASYRLIGVNAPDPGECLADEAAERLAELTDQIVRVEEDVEPFDQFDRRLVYVYFEGSRVATSTETEVGSAMESTFVNEVMVAEGLAIAIHSEPNRANRVRLFSAQDQAQEEQAGIWDAEACGDGPLASIEIIDLAANPPGPDEDALDDEWVVVANTGPEPVDLTGWMIRDESTQNRYTFPSEFVLGPGEDVTVTAGAGDFGFGMESPIWNNAGDTALVVDDQGRFVAYLTVTG